MANHTNLPTPEAMREEDAPTRRTALRLTGAAVAGGAVAALAGPRMALAATDASDVTVADLGGQYSGADVEAVLAELPAHFEYAANVRAFGAVGDGSTDDTAAVQAAINSFPASSGGVVFLPSTPANTYMVSTLYVADRVHIVGAHREVTLKKIGGTSGPVLTHGTLGGGGAYAAGFRNLTIDGNKSNCPNGTDGIGAYPGDSRTAYRGDFNVFENLIVRDCKRHGLYIGDMTNATYLVMMSGVWSHHNGGRGIALIKVFDSRFLTGWVAENAAGQYLLNGCVNVAFVGPQVEGKGTNSTYPGVETDDSSGVGNAVVSFVAATFTGHRKAFDLRGSIGDVRITGCLFDKNSDQAAGVHSTIELNPGSAQQTAVTINGNFFGQDGETNDVSVVGYHVKVGSPSGAGSVSGLSITANQFRVRAGSPSLGILSLPVSGAITDVQIAGNAGYSLPLGCSLSTSSFTHSANGSTLAVPFDAAGDDPLGMHSPSTNPERVAIQRDGLYRVSLSLQFADNSAGVRIVDVERNGTFGANVLSFRHAQDAGGRWSAAGSVDLRLSAGDHLKVNVHQSSGGSLAVLYCYFSVQPL